MIMDFDDLRDVVKKAVLDLWDHATLLATDDPAGPGHPRGPAPGPGPGRAPRGQPTAEGSRARRGPRLERQLPAGITLERVAIRETPSCGSAISRPPT